MSDSKGLIESEQWADVLAHGFGARRMTAGDDSCASSGWTVFSRYGVSVGYANFPIGYDDRDSAPRALSCPDVLAQAGMDVARFSSVSRAEPACLERFWRCDLPETCIEDVGAWQETALASSVRKKISKSLAAGVAVRDARSMDSELLYDMYADTISRNRGSMRYTRRYFDALTDLASRDSRLSIGMVHSRHVDPCGFIVVAHCGIVSYYLHGGFLAQAAAQRPGYVAMAWAIRRSQEVGSRRFNMLTSPADQPSLVAYKESFGGQTYPRRYYERALTAKGWLAGRALELAGRLRRAAR